MCQHLCDQSKERSNQVLLIITPKLYEIAFAKDLFVPG